ncbi:hypothetical protein DWF00_05995 [Bosea caraganae]|uniref:DUF995 domain-containing protein n=1 Tax=Bosea caraganae TaxID=2763117 RepID=A0A370L4M5_9HYPH|nr:hypothetical protein [Bosea caraganae]RDJ22915.1 hypothetical protein DWE98_17240 [Bosea caraganae]RDJ28695.1 hypothetical protein DWF00_05995 [Bosea caraganae]
MRRIGILAAMAALALLSQPAGAADKLTGEQIRRAFEGNTVSGRYTWGGSFTEYHLPDGRALGYNGWKTNTDACWTIRQDQICYYYGPPSARTVYCSTLQLTAGLYVQHDADGGRLNAMMTVEPGNPRGHTDNGKPWVCDGLISQAPGQGAPLSRRLAAR